MSFSLIWKLGMVALVVGTIFFLSYIFPNIRTPKWRRKIISAKYLRDRQHFDLADQVLEGAMKEFPAATDVYHVYYQYYSTPEDMKKIYDIFAHGYENTHDAGLGVVMAKMLVEEGDVDKAAELIASTEAQEYMLTHNLPIKAQLYYRQGNLEQAEKEYLDFYKKLYPDAQNEKEIFSDFQPEELIFLALVRWELKKDWRSIVSCLPVKSIMEEDDWLSLYQKLKEDQPKLTVKTGVYGPAENLLEFRKSEIEKKIAFLHDVMKAFM